MTLCPKLIERNMKCIKIVKREAGLVQQFVCSALEKDVALLYPDTFFKQYKSSI